MHAASAWRYISITAKIGSIVQAGLSGAAVGMAATARVLTLATLAPAATARKRRRFESIGVFVGGVLCTLLALAIWIGLCRG
jgi:uncharacterized membrane protein YkvI